MTRSKTRSQCRSLARQEHDSHAALPFAIIAQRFFRQLIQFPGFGVGFNLSIPCLFPRLHEFFKLFIGQTHDNVFKLLQRNCGHCSLIANSPRFWPTIELLDWHLTRAYDNNDAAAVAALFTEDAVLVTTQGPIYGREAIEKHYADVFQKVHFSNHIAKPDQYSPHVIGVAGNEMWWS